MKRRNDGTGGKTETRTETKTTTTSGTRGGQTGSTSTSTTTKTTQLGKGDELGGGAKKRSRFQISKQ